MIFSATATDIGMNTTAPAGICAGATIGQAHELVPDAVLIFVDEEIRPALELEHRPAGRDRRSHDAKWAIFLGARPGGPAHLVEQLEIEQAPRLGAGPVRIGFSDIRRARRSSARDNTATSSLGSIVDDRSSMPSPALPAT